MNLLTRVISSAYENGYRLIKVLRLGKSDAQTADELSPAGVDASPIADMEAIFADTSVNGQPVIVGYLNKNRKALPGELRLYSTDDSGNEQTYTWLKKDGSIEIGGDQDYMVRYNKLNEEMQNLAAFLNQQLPLIASGIATGGGSYAPATATIDISAAKINNVKTS